MKAIKNYYAPTPVFWRKIGDFALLLLPAVHLLIANAPNLSENQSYWLIGLCDALLIGAKFWTNTKKVH